MEISKDALLRVVKAARLSLRLAEDMRCLLVSRGSRTVPDDISGQLCDALFDMCHERIDSSKDFIRDTETMRLLTGRMGDSDVADAFIQMAERNSIHQPEPHTFSREEFNANYEKVGGYRFETPEGDWK